MDRDWLTSVPKIVGGRLVFKGTRVTLESVPASLAEGDSMEAILKSFPSLKAEQVRQAIALTAKVALESERFFTTPHEAETR